MVKVSEESSSSGLNEAAAAAANELLNNLNAISNLKSFGDGSALCGRRKEERKMTGEEIV